MASNYSEDQVSMMIEKYSANPSRDTVDELADILDKSVKSIIGKLSREGVYQKAIYRTKTGELPITKAQLIVEFATLLEADRVRPNLGRTTESFSNIKLLKLKQVRARLGLG